MIWHDRSHHSEISDIVAVTCNKIGASTPTGAPNAAQAARSMLDQIESEYERLPSHMGQRDNRATGRRVDGTTGQRDRAVGMGLRGHSYPHREARPSADRFYAGAGATVTRH